MFITERDVVLDLINFIKRSNALHLHSCQEQILLKMCRRTIISGSTLILPLLSSKSNLVLDVKCMNSTMPTDLILNHHQERRMLRKDPDGVFPLEHMHFLVQPDFSPPENLESEIHTKLNPSHLNSA